jgi:mono/diheme cytochrome c family protein
MTQTAMRAAAFVVALSAVAWFSPGVGAETQPAPFAAGDAAAGRAMADSDCVACHAQRFAGKPEEMYLRPDHKVRTPEQLLAQIQRCNVQLGKGYFPEEEEHLAAYLNLQYYKFKP